MTEFLEKLIQIIREFLEKQKEDRETPDENFEGQATIGIIVGHTKRSGGASLNNQAYRNEYEYNSRVAEIAKSYADVNFSKNVTTHIIFRDFVGISGAYRKANQLKCDVVVELHFNAVANNTVTGTETLCTSHVGDKAYARYMQDMQTKVFKRGNDSRGVKVLSRGARGFTNVSSFPLGYNCLVEPFFGSNLKDAKLAIDVQEEYAEGLIEASVNFCKEHLGILK